MNTGPGGWKQRLLLDGLAHFDRGPYCTCRVLGGDQDFVTDALNQPCAWTEGGLSDLRVASHRISCMDVSVGFRSGAVYPERSAIMKSRSTCSAAISSLGRLRRIDLSVAPGPVPVHLVDRSKVLHRCGREMKEPDGYGPIRLWARTPPLRLLRCCRGHVGVILRQLH